MIPVNQPSLSGNEAKYLAECIKTGWISSEGPFVKRLEAGMAELCGRRHGIAVCNGSVAICAGLAVGAAGMGRRLFVTLSSPILDSPLRGLATVSASITFGLCLALSLLCFVGAFLLAAVP